MIKVCCGGGLAGSRRNVWVRYTSGYGENGAEECPNLTHLNIRSFVKSKKRGPLQTSHLIGNFKGIFHTGLSESDPVWAANN